jgi:hypothetical protein
MHISEREMAIPAPRSDHLLAEVEREVRKRLSPGEVPVRFAVAASDRGRWSCEVGVIEGDGAHDLGAVQSIFEVRQRPAEDTRSFNVVLLVPTGIGSEIGGHAGDAMPVAALAASVVDTLVTHPNVVNASDIMELPPNALYVEGSVIARMMTGAVALRRVRANRVLVVIDRHDLQKYVDAAVNSVSAARVSFGLDVTDVVEVEPRVRLRSRFTGSGRAVGEVTELDALLDVLDDRRGAYDAVALSTQVEVPINFHLDYYKARGAMVNPWGGAEAIFTHAVSSMYDVPTAHSPMLESKEVEDLDAGVVDPRMAAEAISTAFFVCVLKGLQRSPQLVPVAGRPAEDELAAEHVSALVIPDGAIGVPTLAALEQGIPVIAVRENRNILHNDLHRLPWRRGQLLVVDNYWEAVGVLAALRTGIDTSVVRRPIADTRVVIARAREAVAARAS